MEKNQMSGFLPFIRKQHIFSQKQQICKAKPTGYIQPVSMPYISAIVGIAILTIMIFNITTQNAHALRKCDSWVNTVPNCPDPLTPNPSPPIASTACISDCTELFDNKATLSPLMIPLDENFNPNIANNLETILTPPTTISQSCKQTCNENSVTESCPPATPQSGVVEFCNQQYSSHNGVPEILARKNECTTNCPAHFKNECGKKCEIRDQCKSTICSGISGGLRNTCNDDCDALARCSSQCRATDDISCFSDCAYRQRCETFCTEEKEYSGEDLNRCETMCLSIVKGRNSLTNQNQCDNYCIENHPDPTTSLYGSSTPCTSYWYPTIKVGVKVAGGATCSFIEIKKNHNSTLRIDWGNSRWNDKTFAFDRTSFGFTRADTMRYGYYAGIVIDEETGTSEVCVFDGGLGDIWPDNAFGVPLAMDLTSPRRSYSQARDHQLQGEDCSTIPLPAGPPPCCRNLATAPPMPVVQSIEQSPTKSYVPSVATYSTFTEPRIRVIFDPSNRATDLYVDLKWDYTSDRPGIENEGMGQGECKNMIGPTGKSRRFCTRMEQEHTQLCAYDNSSGVTVGCVERTLNMTSIMPRPLLKHTDRSSYSRPEVKFTFASKTLTLAHTLNYNDRCGVIYGRAFCADRRTDHPNYLENRDEVIAISGFYNIITDELQAHEIQTRDDNEDGLAVLAPAKPCPNTNVIDNDNGYTRWESAEALYDEDELALSPIITAPCQPGWPGGTCKRCPVGYREHSNGPPTRQCIRLGLQSSKWGPVTNPCIENICPAGPAYNSQRVPGYEAHKDTYWPQTKSSKDYYTPKTVTAVAEAHNKPICRHLDYKVGTSGAPQRTCDYNGNWSAPSTITRACIEKGCIQISSSAGNRNEHAYATWSLGKAGYYYRATSCIGERDVYSPAYTLYNNNRSLHIYGSQRRQDPVRKCSHDPNDPLNMAGVWDTPVGICRRICPRENSSFGTHWDRKLPGEVDYESCGNWRSEYGGDVRRECRSNGMWGHEDTSGCVPYARAEIHLKNGDSKNWKRVWWSGDNIIKRGSNGVVFKNFKKICADFNKDGTKDDDECDDFTHGLEKMVIERGEWILCTEENLKGNCRVDSAGTHNWPKAGGHAINSIGVRRWDVTR